MGFWKWFFSKEAWKKNPNAPLFKKLGVGRVEEDIKEINKQLKKRKTVK